MLLAIETSCDETAVAVADIEMYLRGEQEWLLSDTLMSQVALHREYGGVVPELAAREHIGALPILLNRALADSGRDLSDISAIAVTRGPGLKGCLLVGVSFARALAARLSLPLLELNHLEGHLMSGELVRELEFPVLSLLVSGGHTQLVYSREFRSYEVIAETRDDAAGEAFDKCATLLGFPYPGGPQLSQCAAQGRLRGPNTDMFSFPKALKNDDSAFSFSGLKTSVRITVDKLGGAMSLTEDQRQSLSLAAEDAIVGALIEKSITAFEKLNPRTVLLCGGVAANTQLREKLLEVVGEEKLVVPAPRHCTDNAAMIAALALKLMKSAGGDIPFVVSQQHNGTVVSRWPLEELSNATL